MRITTRFSHEQKGTKMYQVGLIARAIVKNFKSGTTDDLSVCVGWYDLYRKNSSYGKIWVGSGEIAEIGSDELNELISNNDEVILYNDSNNFNNVQSTAEEILVDYQQRMELNKKFENEDDNDIENDNVDIQDSNDSVTWGTTETSFFISDGNKNRLEFDLSQGPDIVAMIDEFSNDDKLFNEIINRSLEITLADTCDGIELEKNGDSVFLTVTELMNFSEFLELDK